MEQNKFSRREFLKRGTGAALFTAIGTLKSGEAAYSIAAKKPVVSVVKIKNDKIGFAVEKAIDLLGGIRSVTRGKERIMLKPNLVNESPDSTTKPVVVKTLAQLMKNSGKEVLIGEGSAAASGFNVKEDVVYRTKKKEILDKMQQFIFDTLGYTELAKSMRVPLINLHSGEMAEVKVPNGFVFDKITLHRSVTDSDLLCSVPMMKTHVLATVTLGMKNLIGLYPGTVYYSARSWLHDHAAKQKSPGIAFETIDMVRANKLGLVVVDGSMAMEGDGPSKGSLLKMNLIIAGTNPLATDMVTAYIMGFETSEIPTFTWANKAGMNPTNLAEIEVRGEKIDNVRRRFVRPNVITWDSISKSWGVQEI